MIAGAGDRVALDLADGGGVFAVFAEEALALGDGLEPVFFTFAGVLGMIEDRDIGRRSARISLRRKD